ncbi:hypothetical protein [Peristeroidobacter soli]|uniref:hypothetical protein n=1 Tax=Peristeroidobacter soli TaxID=2497877 RepID=UPI00101CD382|nr:hypothetical protein [Peristeroidobacter soli]
MWNDVALLRVLGFWLQWTAIGLVFIGGLVQVATFLVDRHEKELSDQQALELAKPGAQIVGSGTALIELIVNSSDVVNAHYMDSGAYVALAKGTDALMVFRSLDSFAAQAGNNQVHWRASLSLDPTDPSVGRPLGSLTSVEYVQLGFGQLKSGAQVASGKIIVTINGVHGFTFPIGAQIVDQDRLFVRTMEGWRAWLR